MIFILEVKWVIFDVVFSDVMILNISLCNMGVGYGYFNDLVVFEMFIEFYFDVLMIVWIEWSYKIVEYIVFGFYFGVFVF